MIEFLVATALTCHESQEVIDSLKQYQTLSEYREELIEVIKVNTEHQCYEEGSNVLDS
tara:strand:+ start:254 stop:427 length:174 start_codon:yes stop_codon:yes gene_type:complete